MTLEEIREEMNNRFIAAKDELSRAQIRFGTVGAELTGFDRAVASILTVRQDIQSVVMALFDDAPAGYNLNEQDIQARTKLPIASVQHFLKRAKKLGKLRFENGVYKLPQTNGE